MMNRDNLFNKPNQPARYTFCDRKQNLKGIFC